MDRIRKKHQDEIDRRLQEKKEAEQLQHQQQMMEDALVPNSVAQHLRAAGLSELADQTDELRRNCMKPGADPTAQSDAALDLAAQLRAAGREDEAAELEAMAASLQHTAEASRSAVGCYAELCTAVCRGFQICCSCRMLC